jgi:hypothetical protein
MASGEPSVEGIGMGREVGKEKGCVRRWEREGSGKSHRIVVRDG